MRSDTSVEVLLVQSVGAFYFGAGTPQVICRCEAVPPFRSARDQDRRISCLVWKGTWRKEEPGAVGSWHEFSPRLGLDASQEFLDYLSMLTLPDSSTFQGEFDEGATLQHIFLRVRRNADIRLYDINMYLSGFTGDGAESIKALCRRLFALAGYFDYNNAIYGSNDEALDIKNKRALLKQKYGNAYQKLSEILFAEDPAGINFETNTDEYEPEVSAILPHLNKCNSLDDVNRVVCEEFIKWFSGTAAFPERYPKVAKRIWEEVIPELEESLLPLKADVVANDDIGWTPSHGNAKDSKELSAASIEWRLNDPSKDLEHRRPVWAALSELFLDAEIDDSWLRSIAQRLADSGYTVNELKIIFSLEVYPNCHQNLLTTAGNRTGFDMDWLQNQILSNAKQFPQQSPDFLVSGGVVESEWRKVLEMLDCYPS